MTEALTAAGFTAVPAPLGVVEYLRPGAEAVLLALVQPYLHNGTEGWALALTSLRDLYAEAEERGRQRRGRAAAGRGAGATFLPEAVRLGEVTAEMHLALASERLPAAMRGAPVTAAMLAAWADAMTGELDQLLAGADPALEPAPRPPRRGGRGVRRAPRPARRAGSPSASTATTTSARPCAPTPAGRSSTSRASPRSGSPSAARCPRRCATSPGCCARSTTPPPRRSPSAPQPRPRAAATPPPPGRRLGAGQPPALLGAYLGACRRPSRCSPAPPRTRSPCGAPGSCARRCTRSATSSATVPTGWACRCDSCSTEAGHEPLPAAPPPRPASPAPPSPTSATRAPGSSPASTTSPTASSAPTPSRRHRGPRPPPHRGALHGDLQRRRGAARPRPRAGSSRAWSR